MISLLWHEASYVDRLLLLQPIALVLALQGNASGLVIPVARVFTGTAYEKVFFLVHERGPLVLAHLVIGRKLYRVCRAGLLAVPAEDAAGEVYAEKRGIPPAVNSLICLQSYAVHRAGGRAQVARDAPLKTVRVAREYYPAPVPGREHRLLLRVLYRDPFPEGVKEHPPYGLKYAQQEGLRQNI